MLQVYEDIKTKIDRDPEWYDEVGVPRYCEFNPDRVNDIYAKEVILVLIACQNCGKRFKVALSQNTLKIHKFGSFKNKKEMCIHYGDPPRHGDHLGETMNCIDLELLEYWGQKGQEWNRLPEQEVELT